MSSRQAEVGANLLHAPVRAGVPASNRAFAIANEVIQQRSEDADAPGERR
jgi:hypothetical protein